jgi:hypothetical protein
MEPDGDDAKEGWYCLTSDCFAQFLLIPSMCALNFFLETSWNLVIMMNCSTITRTSMWKEELQRLKYQTLLYYCKFRSRGEETRYHQHVVNFWVRYSCGFKSRINLALRSRIPTLVDHVSCSSPKSGKWALPWHVLYEPLFLVVLVVSLVVTPVKVLFSPSIL